MRQTPIRKKVLSAALSLTLLAGAAGAAPLISPNPAAGTEAAGTAAAAAAPWENPAAPLLLRGRITALEEDRLTLESSEEGASYPAVILNIQADTYLLDAVSGEAKTLADLQVGDELHAYAGPAMTRSLPPIANAVLILCNIPADYAAPTYAEAQSVTVGEDGRVSVLTDRGVIFHLDGETALAGAPAREGETQATPALADLKPGARLLAWYEVVALSYPAQATPAKVMVFPYGYSGWISASEGGVTLNGAPLELSDGETPRSLDGELMLPLRKVAEALGYSVIWRAETGDIDLQMDDMVIQIPAPITAVDGVSFLPLAELAGTLSLKAAAAW